MNDNPISYAFLTGYLQQTLKTLTSKLIHEGFVDRDKEDELQKMLNVCISDAHKHERSHSSQFKNHNEL
jgi:deoxyxylulose-5-phosphate synthase